MERLTAIVSGRVQMVMYRDFVQRKASSLRLVGEVLNLTDGTVRIIAEGPRNLLNRLEMRLWKGSLLSHVEDVQSTYGPAIGQYTKFTITYE